MLEAVIKVFDVLVDIGNFLWGTPMFVCLTAISIIFTIGTKGFQFTHFVYSIKNTLGKRFVGVTAKEGTISPFKATCLALCNTLGVGNIVGVSLAVSLGGPGAIFWIWVAGILALSIKYAEITLGVKYREKDPATGMYRGGFIWYVEKGLGKKWKWLSVVYAVVLTVVYINAPAVQVNSAVSAVTNCFPGIPTLLLGTIFALIVFFILNGGLKRVSGFAEAVVPVMAGAYFILTLLVLILNITELPAAFGAIFYHAVTDTKAITGGFGGATVAAALRYGIARGFYSNGAGTGDSPMAHAAADVEHPSQQGMWGITEVVIDVLVCTCTGLAVLVTGTWETGLSGAPLTASAFSAAFHSTTFGNVFVAITIVLFAITTATACGHYGSICLGYLTKSKVIRFLYICVISLWAVFECIPTFVENISFFWSVGDFNVAITIFLNLIALFLLRKDVFQTTEDFRKSISTQKQK